MVRAGCTVQSAILDVAAILRLHNCVIRMATVIRTRRSLVQASGKAQQLSPDARSIAEHATMQPLGGERQQDSQQPSPDNAPASTSLAPEDGGLSLQQDTSDLMSFWTLQGNPQLILHHVSGTQAILLAQRHKAPDIQQQPIADLPVLDTGQPPGGQRLNSLRSAVSSGQDAFMAGLDARGSLDFLSGMDQDGIRTNFQGKSSWPWAAYDDQPSSSGQTLEGLAETQDINPTSNEHQPHDAPSEDRPQQDSDMHTALPKVS